MNARLVSLIAMYVTGQGITLPKSTSAPSAGHEGQKRTAFLYVMRIKTALISDLHKIAGENRDETREPDFYNPSGGNCLI